MDTISGTKLSKGSVIPHFWPTVNSLLSSFKPEIFVVSDEVSAGSYVKIPHFCPEGDRFYFIFIIFIGYFHFSLFLFTFLLLVFFFFLLLFSFFILAVFFVLFLFIYFKSFLGQLFCPGPEGHFLSLYYFILSFKYCIQCTVRVRESVRITIPVNTTTGHHSTPPSSSVNHQHKRKKNQNHLVHTIHFLL